MSRTVDTSDPSKLSDQDKVYLAQRGLLPTSVASIEEQRSVLDLSGALPIGSYAHTGDVNVGFAGLGGFTTEQLEEEVVKRQRSASKEKLGDRIGSEYPIDYAPNSVKPFGTLPVEGGESRLELQLKEQSDTGQKLRKTAVVAVDDADEEEEDDEEVVDYQSMTNDDLRTELAGRNLSTDGKKPALIARLEADDETE